MLSLCFSVFLFLKIFIPVLSSKTKCRTKTKIWGKHDPYLEGIEVRFQQDPFLMERHL